MAVVAAVCNRIGFVGYSEGPTFFEFLDVLKFLPLEQERKSAVKFVSWTLSISGITALSLIGGEVGAQSKDTFNTTSSNLTQGDLPLVGGNVAAWDTIKSGVDKDSVLKALNSSGWSMVEASAKLASDGKYDVLSRSYSPGVSGILVVPKDGTGEVIEFSPEPVKAAWWPAAPNSEAIKNEILNGMQAAVEAICSMKARPAEIRAKASAVGIVEVEVLWKSAEVCDTL